MSTKYAYLYTPDGFADWEPPFLISELNSGEFFADRGTRLPVRTVGRTTDPITTWGGLRVSVDRAVDELDPATAAVLILPGAETWLEPVHDPIIATARRFIAAQVPVAAICGATMALANAGLLDDVRHTSNALEPLLAQCPGYGGRQHYVEAPAVADDGIITASGLAPLEFARETLATLDVFDPQVLDAWYRLGTTRDPAVFAELHELLSTSA